MPVSVIVHGALLLSIPDACTALGGISRTTIYQLVEEKEVELVKIGRRSFITNESLRSFVKRNSSG